MEDLPTAFQWSSTQLYESRSHQYAKMTLARNFIQKHCLLSLPEDPKNFDQVAKSLWLNKDTIKIQDKYRESVINVYDKENRNYWRIVPNSETDEFILVLLETTLCLGGSHSYVLCDPRKITNEHGWCFPEDSLKPIVPFEGRVDTDKSVHRNGIGFYNLSFESRPTLIEVFTKSKLVILFSDHNRSVGSVYIHDFDKKERKRYDVEAGLMYDEIFYNRKVYAKEEKIFLDTFVIDLQQL